LNPRYSWSTQFQAEKGVAHSIADDLKNAGLPTDKIDPAREAEYKMVVDQIAAQMT